MLKALGYWLLGFAAAKFFTLLNVLMGGNLPPFGCVYVIVKEQEQYLLVEERNGRVVLPGGFMRWHENPRETGRRECLEETGMQVRVNELIDCFSYPARSSSHMSTLALVYRAELLGGQLRSSIEGRPIWVPASEIKRLLARRCRPFLESYLRAFPSQEARVQTTAQEQQEAGQSNS